MLSKARDFLRVAPHVSIFPGVTIMLTVLGLNLLGDGLRDVLDPRTGPG
jgi:peptide/nickel transport system permease protein